MYHLEVIGWDDESLKQMVQAGCKMAENTRHFRTVCQATDNDPCNGGAINLKDLRHVCPWNRQHKCPAYLALHTKPKEDAKRAKESLARSKSDQSGMIGSKFRGQPIRKIAKALGISLNKARMMKWAGELLDREDVADERVDEANEVVQGANGESTESTAEAIPAVDNGLPGAELSQVLSAN